MFLPKKNIYIYICIYIYNKCIYNTCVNIYIYEYMFRALFYTNVNMCIYIYMHISWPPAPSPLPPMSVNQKGLYTSTTSQLPKERSNGKRPATVVDLPSPQAHCRRALSQLESAYHLRGWGLSCLAHSVPPTGIVAAAFALVSKIHVGTQRLPAVRLREDRFPFGRRTVPWCRPPHDR